MIRGYRGQAYSGRPGEERLAPYGGWGSLRNPGPQENDPAIENEKLNHRGHRARRGKNGPLPTASRKVKSLQGLSEKDLCDLCFLFVHIFVLIPGGLKGKEKLISIK
jgi:hypothetical protein